MFELYEILKKEISYCSSEFSLNETKKDIFKMVDSLVEEQLIEIEKRNKKNIGGNK